MLLTFFFILIYFTVLAGGIWAWYKIWFKNGYCSLPVGQDDLSRMNSDQQYTTTDLYEFFKKFRALLFRLKPTYWISACGLDGYCYMYWQRQVLIMIGLFLIEFLCIRTYILFSGVRDINFGFFNLKTSGIDFSKDSVLQEQCMLIVAYTITIIIIVIRMMEHLKDVFVNHYIKNEQLDLKNLQLRTLHIQGMLMEDIKAEVLKNQINEYLKQVGGSIVAINIVPNFAGLVEMEVQRKELEYMRRLIQADETLTDKWYIPKKYRFMDEFEEEREKIDNEIQRESERRFLSSGHAFICFDTMKTMRKASEFLHLDPKKIINFTMNNAQNFQLGLYRKRSIRFSTFMKFEDEVEHLAERYKDVELFMKESPESEDIIWENLGGDNTRGVNILRIIIMQLCAFFVLVFFTTPNQIFEFLNDNVLDLKNVSWAFAISNTFGYLMQTFMPPLLTLGINQILLLLIDFAAIYEKPSYHSTYQSSIFNKSTFYLIFNMLLIPGISFNLQSSLYDILARAWENSEPLFNNFYKLDSGIFFVVIVAQSSLTSPLFYLLRANELALNYMSPWIAHNKRQFIHDEERWRKQYGLVFQYGYFGAVMITILFIILVFSTTIPMILVVGLIYFFNKHVIEGLILLVVHKHEIDSFGKLIKQMMRSLVICAFFFQFFFIVMLFEHEAYMSISILLVNSLALLALGFYLRKPFYELIELVEEKLEDNTVDIAHIVHWKKSFRHPLIIKDEEYEVPQITISNPQRSSTRKRGLSPTMELSNVLHNKESHLASY